MIKFNSAIFSNTTRQYIDNVLKDNNVASNIYCQKAEKRLMEITKTKQLLLTHSCTAALEMAAILVDIQPGDEVIMPSYTFVSTANAFALRGAKLIFIDIKPDTLNINENLIEAAITEKTKAIVPMHYGAVSCNMDTIMAIANKYRLYVIEDAAQCPQAYYKNNHLGSIGHLGTFSFHHTKNITSGLGGSLLINDPKFIERAKIIWQKGTNREAFLEGQVDKYTWVDLGSSNTMPELSAALLYSQLEQIDQIHARRLEIWEQYQEGLTPLASKKMIQLPTVPQDCKHNAHIFYLICNSHQQRCALQNHLLQAGIQTTFHYIPLHSSPAGQRLGKFHGDDLYTSDLSSRLLRLPLHLNLNNTDIIKIIDQIHAFFKRENNQ